MSKSGFLCPHCNSWDTEYVGVTEIECNTCGYIWDPGEENDDEGEMTCPRCGSNDIDIDDDGEFLCNDCGLEGDVDDLDSTDCCMTREQAIEEYNRTGVNHSEYDLNDWDDINRRLGYDFFKPKK